MTVGRAAPVCARRSRACAADRASACVRHAHPALARSAPGARHPSHGHRSPAASAGVDPTAGRGTRSALSQHPVAAHAVGEAAGEILEAFGGEDPDLVVCFVSPHFVGAFDDFAYALGQPARARGAHRRDRGGRHRRLPRGRGRARRVAVRGVACPTRRLTPVSLTLETTPDGPAITGWPELDHDPGTLVLLTDPFSFPTDGFLRQLGEIRPGLQVIGGAASAARGPGGNRLVLGDRVDAHRGGRRAARRRRGDHGRLAGLPPARPPLRRHPRRAEPRRGARRTARAVDGSRTARPRRSDEDRELIRHGLHVGLVVDEHKVEFGRGDFLVRNVVGADPESGALAIGDEVSVGQTVQFHVRDAAAADEDLRALLAGHDAGGALLFTCNGRGQHFFGTPDHDAGVVDRLLGPLPIAGAFCAGEIGPVGGRNFVHGFTASLALFA